MLKNIDISASVWETERLMLRELQAADVEAIKSYWNINGFDAHIHLRFPTAQKAWENYEGEVKSGQRQRYYFAILLKSEKSLIGAIRLDALPESSEGCNLHLEMSPTHAGKGYITEAAKWVMQWATENLELSFLKATAHPDNAASRRVIDKLGFEFIEIKHAHLVSHKGEVQDRAVYKKSLL